MVMVSPTATVGDPVASSVIVSVSSVFVAVVQTAPWMVAHVCSRANGCRYCTAHTLKNGAHYGLPQEKVEAVWEYEHNPLFSSAERAALNVALAGGHSPAIVTDADMAELRKHFTDEQVVEIVLVISLFGFNNRWNTIMGTELEPVVTEFQERNKKAFAAE